MTAAPSMAWRRILAGLLLLSAIQAGALAAANPADTLRALNQKIRATNSADPSMEQLLTERVRLIDESIGDRGGDLSSALSELAAFYENVERYPYAERYRKRALEIAIKNGSAPGRMDARLAMAHLLEEQERYREATPFIVDAMEDARQIAPNETRPKRRLGPNLLAQKRYAEAEPYIREFGDLRELAETLEGLKRWGEAEPIWRQVNNMDRLEENLRKQGKLKEATAVAERRFAQNAAAQAGRASGQLSKEQAEGLQRAEQNVRQLVAHMDEDSARATLAMAEMHKAQATGNTAALKEAQKSLLAMMQSEQERQLAQTKGADQAARRSELEAQLAMVKLGRANLDRPVSQTWADRPPPNMALEQAVVGIKQAEVGSLDAAERNLAEACPTLRSKTLIDTLGPASVLPTLAPLSASECFAELALVRAKRKPLASGGIDAEAFVAAQLATQTEAASALTRSAARTFARRRGAEGLLDSMDVHAKAMEAHGKRLFAKWPPARFAELQEGGRFPAEMMNDMAQMSEQTRPDALAIDGLLKDLEAKVPGYFELRSPEPVSLDALQARQGANANLLNGNEALVLWLVVPGHRQGLVFAVSKTRTAWSTIGLSGTEIDKRVAKLRHDVDPCALDARSSDCTSGIPRLDLLASWELHQALLGSPAIQGVIGGKDIDTLMIVPSGSLTALPPALLLTERPTDLTHSPEVWQNSSWLITKKALSVMPAISALRTLRAAAPAPAGSVSPAIRSETLFMIANPDFSGRGAGADKACVSGTRGTPVRSVSTTTRDIASSRTALAQLQPLPCTQLEGVALQKALGGTLLTGRDAREAQLRTPMHKALLERAKVVAFATHGIVAGSMGQSEPGLALAAPLPGESGDDGLLTASEIAGMKLSADWVLLSACNTASPDAVGVPGLSGLSRAFFFAGASGVLVSHWRVDDEATAALVSRSVELRRQGQSKAKALQKASEDLMMRGAQTAHPRFWASFTTMGEPR